MIAAHCDLEAERRTNRRFLELEMRGGEQAFAAALRALGCQCALPTAAAGAVSSWCSPPVSRCATSTGWPASSGCRSGASTTSATRWRTSSSRRWRRAMAVFDRRFRPYAGPLTPRRRRFLVVAALRLPGGFPLALHRGFLRPLLGAGGARRAATSTCTTTSTCSRRWATPPPACRRPTRASSPTPCAARGCSPSCWRSWSAPAWSRPTSPTGALPLYLARPLTRGEYVARQADRAGGGAVAGHLGARSSCSSCSGQATTALAGRATRASSARSSPDRGSGFWWCRCSPSPSPPGCAGRRWPALCSWPSSSSPAALGAIINMMFDTVWGYLFNPSADRVGLGPALLRPTAGAGAGGGGLDRPARAGRALPGAAQRKLRPYEVVR